MYDIPVLPYNKLSNMRFIFIGFILEAAKIINLIYFNVIFYLLKIFFEISDFSIFVFWNIYSIDGFLLSTDREFFSNLRIFNWRRLFGFSKSRLLRSGEREDSFFTFSDVPVARLLEFPNRRFSGICCSRFLPFPESLPKYTQFRNESSCFNLFRFT